MQTVEDILNKLGLTENQTKVFLGAVKAGLAPVSQVAKQAGIARTYAYEIAEELKQKGLLAEIEHEKIKKVQALDYGGLLSYIQRRQRDMRSLEKDLEKAEGEFQALRTGLPQKTKVRFFEGVEGIKSINAEIKKDLEKLSTPYQFYVVFSADRMESVLPGWIEQNQHIYFEPMMKKFAIISETPLLSKFLGQVKKAEQKNLLYKIWPKEKLEFSTDTLCWQNKIAYLDMKGSPSGIIIENSAIVQTFVMWFKQMWEGLKTP
jgi:hypothetical protein